jgi:multidrug efflux pump subunit AcrA (membrane-fusion protein)/YHS domain-containing protein
MEIAGKTVAGLVLCLGVGFFAGGAWWSLNTPSPKTAAGARRILYYHDPMHPAYKSDKPGIAPDCGMQLEPVYSDEEGAAGGPADGSIAPPGTVRISAEKQQLIGVRVEEVRQAAREENLRILGRVVADETRVYKVNAGADGLVREVGTATTGSLLKKGDVLASYFTADSVTFRTQQNYLNLLGTKGDMSLAEFAKDTLALAGLSDAQVEEMARTRKLTSTYNLTSPVTGIVLARNLSPGQRFEKGFEFYRIADLSSVWVVASVFENDARLLRSVSGATVRYLSRTFPTRMSSVLPEFDASTRALKVRLEVANAGYELRPDMFVDVDFKVNVRSAIVAPVGAVMDTGLRKAVFVDRGNGFFEPRKVETGARLGDSIIITRGLTPGERIVVSGNFLIDSESRFQLAAAGAAPAAAKDPVCGMRLDPSKPARYQATYNGITYNFCSESCRTKFVANPAMYVMKKDENGAH